MKKVTKKLVKKPVKKAMKKIAKPLAKKALGAKKMMAPKVAMPKLPKTFGKVI
jgi:hypothetical protein